MQCQIGRSNQKFAQIEVPWCIGTFGRKRSTSALALDAYSRGSRKSVRFLGAFVEPQNPQTNGSLCTNDIGDKACVVGPLSLLFVRRKSLNWISPGILGIPVHKGGFSPEEASRLLVWEFQWNLLCAIGYFMLYVQKLGTVVRQIVSSDAISPVCDWT